MSSSSIPPRKSSTSLPFLVLAALVLLGPDPASGLQPGDLAPSFCLRDSSGRNFCLRERIGPATRTRARGLILNFFASYCQPCRWELPLLDSLVEELRSQGIEVVIIGLGEDSDRFSPLLSELGVKRPIALADPYGKVGARYQVRFLPTTFLISREGRIQEIIRGELPGWEQMIRERAALLGREGPSSPASED